MAPNDTTNGDEATLFPSEQGTDAPAPRRRATRRTTKKATTIVPTADTPAVARAEEPSVATAPEDRLHRRGRG